MPFEEFKTMYGIPAKHFLKYLQGRNFTMTRHNNNLEIVPLSAPEEIILKHLNSKEQESLLYDMFVNECKESPKSILQAWYKDLEENVSEEEWSEACSLVQTQTVNSQNSFSING